MITSNPSGDRRQPVPDRPITRPPVPRELDGLEHPMTCDNTTRDRWTGRRRTRPAVPNPGERRPHLTDPPNPSHRTTRQATTTPTHRSATHAPTNPDGPPTDRIRDTPDSDDTADPLEDNRVPRPRPSTPAPDAQTAARRTTRRRRATHAEGKLGTATANAAATVQQQDTAARKMVRAVDDPVSLAKAARIVRASLARRLRTGGTTKTV